MGEKLDRERTEGERDEPYERFEDTLRKLVQVPKEELNEKLAEHERRQEQEKRAG